MQSPLVYDIYDKSSHIKNLQEKNQGQNVGFKENNKIVKPILFCFGDLHTQIIKTYREKCKIVIIVIQQNYI